MSSYATTAANLGGIVVILGDSGKSSLWKFLSLPHSSSLASNTAFLTIYVLPIDRNPLTDWSTNYSAEVHHLHRPPGSRNSPGDSRWQALETTRIDMPRDVWALGAMMSCLCKLGSSPGNINRRWGVLVSKYGEVMNNLVRWARCKDPQDRPSSKTLWR